ncbi:MAG: SDR family oxidoreductase, partial [Sphingobium sp.]
ARLAGEGAKVVIAGRSEERALGAMERLEVMAPGRVAMCLADMTEKAGVAAAVAATRDRFGSPDIAISNVIGHKVTADAEGPPPGFFRDVRTEEYAHEFRQLALSAWWLADAVLPDMRERRWGRIINVGSIVARESRWELPHILPNAVRPVAAGLYSKLAYRHAGSGVTFNSLLTGSIATERNKAYFTWLAAERGMSYEEIDREGSQAIPLHRRGDPDEMAAVAAFLCSDVAGGISGQSIPIAGGVTRHIF